MGFKGSEVLGSKAINKSEYRSKELYQFKVIKRTDPAAPLVFCYHRDLVAKLSSLKSENPP
jgi:hypothetical protein